MQNIYSFALNNAIANGSINRDALIHCIGDLYNEQQMRFIEAIIGCVSIPEMCANLPEKSMVNKGSECTLKDFNYLLDQVTYNYARRDSRWFVHPEDAQKYSETGDYNYNTSNYSETDSCKFQAFYEHDAEDYCSYQRWMDNAIREEV